MRKNSKRKRTLAIVLLVFLLAGLAGCTTFDNFRKTFVEQQTGADEDTIYIGVYEPTSGELREQGQEELKGIELANAIYDNVDGHQIELVVVDNQSDIDTAKTAIQDLIRMKPSAIIGSVGESNSLVASPYVEKAKIPTITPSAANPLITEDNPYYFRVCMTDTQRGAGLAEYAYTELGSRKMAIVSIENDSTVSATLRGFHAELATLAGGSEDAVIAWEGSIDAADDSVKSLVRSIEESEADVVFLPLGAEKADQVFTAIERADLAEEITFLGLPGWSDEDFTEMMDEHPDIRVAFPSDIMVGENRTTTAAVTAETQRFLIEYSNTYGAGETPSENAALGYDAYLLIVNAINNASSEDPEDIRDALESIQDLRCVTGVISMDESGTPQRSVNISTIQDGEVVTLYATGTTKAAAMEKIKQ